MEKVARKSFWVQLVISISQKHATNLQKEEEQKDDILKLIVKISTSESTNFRMTRKFVQ